MAIPRPTYLQRQSATTELAAPQTVADTYRGAYLVAKRQEYENLLASARNELQAEWEQETTRQSIIQDQLQALDRQSATLQRLIETTSAKIDDIDYRNMATIQSDLWRRSSHALGRSRNHIEAIVAVDEGMALDSWMVRSENATTESFENAMRGATTDEEKLNQLRTVASLGARADDVRNINQMATDIQRLQIAGNIYRDLSGESTGLNAGIAAELARTFNVHPADITEAEAVRDMERSRRVGQLAGGVGTPGAPPMHGAGALRQTLASREAEMAALQDQREELAAQIEAVGAPTEEMARQRASERYRPARSLRGQMRLGRDVRRGRRALGRFRDMSPEQQILWGGFQGARRMVGELGGMPGEGQRNEDYWEAAESIYGAMTSESPTMNANDMTSTALSLAQNQLGEASVQEVQAARDEILKYAMGMLMNDHEYTQPSAGTPSDALAPDPDRVPTEGVESIEGVVPTEAVESTAPAPAPTETAEDPSGSSPWGNVPYVLSRVEEHRRFGPPSEDIVVQPQGEFEPYATDVQPQGETPRFGPHLFDPEAIDVQPQGEFDPEAIDVQPQGEFDPEAIDVPPGLPYEPYATDVQPQGPMITADEDIYTNLVRVVQEVDRTQPTANVGRYAAKIMAYMAGEYRPPEDERQWFERVMLVAGLTEEAVRQAQLRMIRPRVPPGTRYLGEEYLQNPGDS